MSVHSSARKTRSRRTRRVAALGMTAVSLLLVLPPAAFAQDWRSPRREARHAARDHNGDRAERGDREQRRERAGRRDRVARNRGDDRNRQQAHRRDGRNRQRDHRRAGNRDRRSHGPRYFSGRRHSYYDGYRHVGYADRHYRGDRYYCEPCNDYFDERYAFHDHLYGVHHVPFWQLPFVIISYALGWIFYG